MAIIFNCNLRMQWNPAIFAVVLAACSVISQKYYVRINFLLFLFILASFYFTVFSAEKLC
jgi:hypothetical protein